MKIKHKIIAGLFALILAFVLHAALMEPALAVDACTADVNQDGTVTDADISLINQYVGTTAINPTRPNANGKIYDSKYDMDGNGSITLQDSGMASTYKGQTCAANIPTTGTRSCVFSPSTVSAGQSIGIIINNFSTGPHTVRLVGTVYGNIALVGSVSGNGGGVTIPINLAGIYEVRVIIDANANVGSDVTCTSGNLTINPPSTGTPGGSTPGSVCPEYETSGGIRISDYFSPAKHFCNVGILSSDILTILISASAALSIIFVIIGGIKLVTSSGDPKATASGRATLTYAIIGLVVTILAFVIVQVVQYFLKASVI